MAKGRVQINIYSTMRNSYEVIEIDNYVIFNTLQNFYFWEFYILSIKLD